MRTIHRRHLIVTVNAMALVVAGLHASTVMAHRYETNVKGGVIGYACKHSDKNAVHGCGISNHDLTSGNGKPKIQLAFGDSSEDYAKWKKDQDEAASSALAAMGYGPGG